MGSSNCDHAKERWSSANWGLYSQCESSSQYWSVPTTTTWKSSSQLLLEENTSPRKILSLDLSHAYNQIVLDDDSKRFLTINTHRGFYCYTRLPFGVVSAPSIILFQRTMDILLQGMKGVVCYLDDVLVWGKLESDHINNLRIVLQKLQAHGIWVKKWKCAFLKKKRVYSTLATR